MFNMSTKQATEKMRSLADQIENLNEKIEEETSPISLQNLRARKGWAQDRLERLENKYPTAAQKV
jgi:hypothetical protein